MHQHGRGVRLFEGSTGEPLKVTVRRDGVLVNLSTVNSITLRAVSESGAVKINDAPVTSWDANGLITYEWADQDVDTPGIYHAAFEIVWASGKKTRAPAPFFRIEIVKRP